MTAMDFDAVMVALAAIPVDAEIVETAYDWPSASIKPPCWLIDYPEGPQAFDATMGRGHDRALFPAYLVVGSLVDRVTRAALNTYLQPIKDAIEAATSHGEVLTPVPWTSVRVASWSVVPFSVGQLDYMAIKFDIDVLT